MMIARYRNSVRLSLAVGLLAAVTALSHSDDEPAAWTPAQILKTKVVGEISLSAGGKRVAFSVASSHLDEDRSEWISQIHVADADGGNSFQLTRGEKSASAPEWSPDGEWVAFLSPRSGAKANLWRIRVNGGEAEQLTDEKGGILSFQWAPDGRSIAFLMPDPKTEVEERAERERQDALVVDENPKRARLYVVEAAQEAKPVRPVRRLTPGEMHCGGQPPGRNYDWSPDSSRIVFTHQPTPRVDEWQKTDLSIVEAASGKITPLVATEAAETQPIFSPDGQHIAFSCSETPPRWAAASQVKVIGSDGTGLRALSVTFDRKPSLIGWNSAANGILVGEVFHTVNRVWEIPTDGSAPRPMTPDDVMVSQPVLDPSRTVLGFVGEATDRPPEVFTALAVSFQPKPVSHVQKLPSLPWGASEVVRWKSTDGLEVEGLLTLPVGYKAGAKVPLLVVIHGGPAGVFVQTCLASRGPYPLAVFAARGFAILRCNVRGSSGYGKEFRFANQSDWGGGDYRDIQTGIDALIERGIADPNRLGVMGWSYGGFMTSWTITQTKRFKAASVGAAVTNLVSFTGTADISGFIPDYMGGDFWDEPQRWRDHSPVMQVKGVSTPTLIQHGDKDLRVPIGQGYEFYNALRRQNVPVKMVVYPRQPHAIQEPKLLLDAMERNLEWFEHWVR